jgi:HEAT repeat protein
MRFPLQWGGKRRLEALRLLAEKGSPEAVEPLLMAASSPEPALQETATDALSRLQGEQALDRLISLAPRYPKEAAEVLVRRGQAVIARVGPLLRSDDPLVQAWAVDVLRRIESPHGKRYLREALLSPQALVRATAAAALAERGQASEELLDLLRSESDTWVKCQVIDALGQAGLEEAAPLMEEALSLLAHTPAPWDARIRLWQSLIRALKALGHLEEALSCITLPSTASLRRWLDIPATLGDIEALCLVFRFSPAHRPEVLAALERASTLHGEEALVEGLAKTMAHGEISADNALQIMRRLHISSDAAARLVPELPAMQEEKEPVLRPTFTWAELQARLSALLQGMGQVHWPAGDREAMQAKLGELVQGLTQAVASEPPPPQPEEAQPPLEPLTAQPTPPEPERPAEAPAPAGAEPPAPPAWAEVMSEAAPEPQPATEPPAPVSAEPPAPSWAEVMSEAAQVIAQLPPDETLVPPGVARRLNEIVERRVLPRLLAAAQEGETSLLSFLSQLTEAAPATLPCTKRSATGRERKAAIVSKCQTATIRFC